MNYLIYVKIKKILGPVFLEKFKNLNLSSFWGVGGPPFRNSKFPPSFFLIGFFSIQQSKPEVSSTPGKSKSELQTHLGLTMCFAHRRNPHKPKWKPKWKRLYKSGWIAFVRPTAVLLTEWPPRGGIWGGHSSAAIHPETHGVWATPHTNNIVVRI